MSSSEPPRSNFPAAMGPGARPLQSGESPGGLLQEISEIRSHYNVHVEADAVQLAYELKGQQRHFRLPFANIPVSGWTQSLCFGGNNSSQITGTLLIDMIRATENISGRNIRQEEAEGLAFYGSRRMMTMYFGQFAGVAIGLGAAWVGRKDMKFPFIKPKSPERYESFPMRVLPLLKGRYARTMWQITRANIYVVMWLFFTNPLFRSVADTRMTVGLYNDRRTHDLTEVIRGKFDRLRSNRAAESGQLYPAASTQTQNPQAQDEASPAAFDASQSYGSQSGYDGDSTFTDGNTDTGLITDAAIQQRQTQQASPNSWSKAQSRGSRQSYQQSESSSSSDDFIFDDASPTAGNDPDMGASKPYQKQRPADAWARLRRGEGSQQEERQPSNRSAYSNQSPDFETKSDSFSFSSGEEDRRLAKGQAQKEFDALLERERQESGSGDYARDMRATEAGESSSSSESAWGRRRGG